MIMYRRLSGRASGMAINPDYIQPCGGYPSGGAATKQSFQTRHSGITTPSRHGLAAAYA